MTSAAVTGGGDREVLVNQKDKKRKREARRQARTREAMMRGEFTERQVERFWAQVDKYLEPEDCWGWTGSFHRNRPYFIGKKAARVVWCLVNEKPFPKGRQAAHLCRNRRCVNPSHIMPMSPEEHRIYDGHNDPREEQ
jgi:hypothetical protein